MQTLVNDLAAALKWVDSSRVPFRHFRPGVGPYGEPQVLRKVVQYLRTNLPQRYPGAVTKRDPDIFVPGQWAIECKIVRPYGDNGELAEHWSQNLLHPYAGNVSSLGDAMKLVRSVGQERRAIVVITYEHDPPQIDLAVLIHAFELIAKGILQLPLGPRYKADLMGLVHPVHQRGTVFGWELLYRD